MNDHNELRIDDLVANIDDVQSTFEKLAGSSGRLALIFDPGKGWCATNIVTPLGLDPDEKTADYRVICPTEWCRERLTAAIAILGLVNAARPKAQGAQLRRPKQ